MAADEESRLSVHFESSKSRRSTSSPTISPPTRERAWHAAITRATLLGQPPRLPSPKTSAGLNFARSLEPTPAEAAVVRRNARTSRPSTVSVPVLSKQSTRSHAAAETQDARTQRMRLRSRRASANTRPNVTVAGNAGGTAIVSKSNPSSVASNDEIPKRRIKLPCAHNAQPRPTSSRKNTATYASLCIRSVSCVAECSSTTMSLTSSPRSVAAPVRTTTPHAPSLASTTHVPANTACSARDQPASVASATNAPDDAVAPAAADEPSVAPPLVAASSPA
mmetsp:Transcript_14873/g.39825  ORF Transcript_14873/g.39825 Transcript_14873/m.39825 type:complete len:279 (-) Transcript_14873:1918-2754(-)